MAPSFESSTVLVDDQFDYVELWLKRHATTKPVIFWKQARNFHRASQELPKESRALTAYYCMLNATKALLAAKGISFSEQHGVAGESQDSRTSLANEVCKIKGAGLLISLADYFGAKLSNREVCLRDVLYNIPFRLKTATMLSPRSLAFRAAVTLVHGACSSLHNRKAFLVHSLHRRSRGGMEVRDLPEL
jgi:hypothetical protein